ncbi:hypothetical protein [Spirosoma fluviale]|uniref:Uncharacterized protein n=1 Tax=Spirosoma fluviale TaxID=1597977 RepID=A0A286GW50_9BACT|nr:hypothetical protein [Spirosoma fluviale]SOD99765.1 hypothetical protein SAMN06269250_0152 [Spirosoma fluviale]
MDFLNFTNALEDLVEKVNLSLLAGVLAGLIAIVAAVAQWKDKKEEEKEAESNRLKVEAAQKEIKILQLKSLKKTDELEKVYIDLNNANKKIIDLQGELKNEITGGESRPVLRIYSSGLVTHEVSRKKYFILNFDLYNPNKYALQNIRVVFHDLWGREMMQLGVVHFRDGLSVGLRPPTVDELNNRISVHHFDNIGSLAKNNTYPLYTTTFCPELANMDTPGYAVEVKWYNGSFVYFVNLKIENDKLINFGTEMSFNGQKVDHEKYIEFH